ncbi:hypothetical protein YC2023_052589 [Brassica napus]
MMTFTHREQHSVNIHDDPDKSKFMGMETNKLHRVNLKSSYCCAVRNFVWDPKSKTWTLNVELLTTTHILLNKR